MNKLTKVLPYAVALATPFFAFGQGTVFTIRERIQSLLNQIIPILLIIGTIVFLWGVITFLLAGANEEKRAEARSLMIYGLIGLFVMVAVWGIVNVLVGFFLPGGNTGIPTSPGDLRGI
ncbi:hypothetical protein A3B18_02390 [Candidatus Giovannonibacteria bacterium RIFCSPLOWO2_01_FULL_46_13]|uniref:Uncharacterized protein n=1 Tax=Candidatus Giovannonibacteria bacterium RIFCSPLOWO2_01_FULL_46_13 TaxID=1798352 RepID=A0A1F5X584_9BACT|nr:MAG: hypothetical protein A3B18_02390 [Candidatus Giovannonibacteria bacterium RIFCSPLOWO2_01_FULL_46_13]